MEIDKETIREITARRERKTECERERKKESATRKNWENLENILYVCRYSEKMFSWYIKEAPGTLL